MSSEIGNLDDAVDVVLDRVLGGDDLDVPGRWLSDNIAYSVVVLPEPVGPVIRTIPCGSWVSSCQGACSSSLFSPSTLQVQLHGAAVEHAQHATLAGDSWGMVATRRSTGRPSIESSMRPSWGMRVSAMSRSPSP